MLRLGLVSILVVAAMGCGKDEDKGSGNPVNPLVNPNGQPGDNGPGGQWVSDCFSGQQLQNYFRAMIPFLQAPPNSSQFYQASLKFTQDGKFEHVVYGYQDRCDGYLNRPVVSLWGGYRLRGALNDFTAAQDVLLSYDDCTVDYAATSCPFRDRRRGSFYEDSVLAIIDGNGFLNFGRNFSGMASPYYYREFRFTRTTSRR